MTVTNPNNHIFLSYARKDDEPFVRKLYDALTAKGLNVWYDREKMPNRGLTFSENIKRAVLDSRRLALIVGPAALTSDYVTKEWRTAFSACIPVIPIMRLGDYANLPPELALTDAPDFRDDAKFDHRLGYLLRQIAEDVPPPGDLHGLRWFQLPRGYILRGELWAELDSTVRGDAISAGVATSREQITALQGLAGLGKTTLAAAYAESCAVRRTFDSGVFWLTAGRTADSLILMTTLGVALGDAREEYKNAEIAAERLYNLLRNRRALIVLDDVWAREVVDAFRPTLGADCRLLFTTRDTRIVALTQAQRVRVDTLSTDDGVRLIGRWLDRPPQDDAAERNPHLGSERAIVKLLQEHTLAVTLAAARIDEVGADYAPTLLVEYQRARDTENPFADLELAPDDRNWSVEISLRLSYDALNETAKAHFRALGVLAENAGFSQEMVAAVWTTDDPQNSLRELEATALVEPEPDGSYLQHAVLRAYAAALLRRERTYDAAFARYADHIIEQAKAFNTLPLEQWGQIDPLLPHVHEVGDTLVKQWQSAGTPDNVLVKRTGAFAYNIIYCVFDPPSRLLLIEFVRLAREKSTQLEDHIYNSVIKTLDITKKKSEDKSLTDKVRNENMDMAWGLTYLVRELVSEFWAERMLNTLGCPLGEPTCNHLIEGDATPANYQLIASTLAEAFIEPRQQKKLEGVTAKRVDKIMYKSLKASYAKRVRFVEVLAESPNKKKVGRWILKLYRQEILNADPDWYLIKSFVEAFLTLEYKRAAKKIEKHLNNGYLEKVRRPARALVYKMTDNLDYTEEPYTDDEIRSELKIEAPDRPGMPFDWKRIEAVSAVIIRHEISSSEVISEMFHVLKEHLHEGARLPIIEALGKVGDKSVFDKLLERIEFGKMGRETSARCRLKILNVLDELYNRLSRENRFTLDIEDVKRRIKTVADNDYDNRVRESAESLLKKF